MKQLSIRFDLIALILAAAWSLAIMLAPPEKVLGTLLRWVFAHASLTQVSLVLFLIAAILAGLYLVGRKQMYGWMQVTGWVALILWVLGFLLSTIPAKLSWGVWIDFSEPRTQMTLQVLAIGIIFLLLTRWVDNLRFTAIAQLVLSVLAIFLNRNAGVVRHPLNPIGTSGTDNIPMLYSLIFLLALGWSAALIVYWVQRKDSGPMLKDTD